MGRSRDRKITGEVSLPIIELDLKCRKYLQWYYTTGGNNTAFGRFKGKIIKNNSRGILFKRIYIDFMEMDGTYVTGKEDHIWIFDKQPFLKANVKEKDCVSFTGRVYAYKRKNGSIDFSLKQCGDIKIIDPYALPSGEYLKRQDAERIACETCLYNEQCFEYCINPDWRDSMVEWMMKLR